MNGRQLLNEIIRLTTDLEAGQRERIIITKIFGGRIHYLSIVVEAYYHIVEEDVARRYTVFTCSSRGVDGIKLSLYNILSNVNRVYNIAA